MSNYSREEVQKVLDDIMAADFKEKSEQASSILRVLNSCPENEQSDMLAYVLQRFKIIDDSDEPMTGDRISKDRYRDIVDRIGDDIHRIFHIWLKKNPSEEDLAHKLWHFLNENLKADDERSVALSIVLFDRHIPYRQIPEEPDLDFGEVQEAMRDKEVQERVKHDAVLVQNILRRKNLSEYVTALLWSIVKHQQSEVEQFAIFGLTLHLLEAEIKSDLTNGLEGAIISALLGRKL